MLLLKNNNGLSSSCLPCVSDSNPNLRSPGTHPHNVSVLQRPGVATFRTQKTLDSDISQPPDFSITVEDETILAHRNLLEESSHYFRCMFECGIQEAQTGTIEVKNIKLSVGRTMISYIYGENISIEWDDVMDYMDIIEMWQLQELKYELEYYIMKNININNSVNWFFVAQKYHMGKLEQMIDAPSKLQLYMDTILQDKTTTMEHGMDLLHSMKLTKCTREFMEIVLSIYKETLSDVWMPEVQPYISMLSQTCRVNRLDRDIDMPAVGDEVIEIEFGRLEAGSINQPRGEGSNNKHSILMIRNREGKKMIIRLNIHKTYTDRSVTEIGSPPILSTIGASVHCLTPCGILSCGDSMCILLDIPSLNCIRLPDLPGDVGAVKKVLCMTMNTTVYAITMNGIMMYLDLQNPT